MRAAVREIERAHVASVVGDVVGYTAIAIRERAAPVRVRGAQSET